VQITARKGTVITDTGNLNDTKMHSEVSTVAVLSMFIQVTKIALQRTVEL